MKKFTYYLLSIPLILSLTACNNSSSKTEKKGSSSNLRTATPILQLERFKGLLLLWERRLELNFYNNIEK